MQRRGVAWLQIHPHPDPQAAGRGLAAGEVAGHQVDAGGQRRGQAGLQVGNYAAYIALQNINDDGWREFSPTTINRMFADLGVKGDGSEFHLNFSGANNSYGITAAAPEELLDKGWDRTFTSPQTTDNQMEMVSVNGSVVVAPHTIVSGVAY